MPYWVDILEAAEAWGMAPWDVEEAPALWLDRRRELASAKVERDEFAMKESRRKAKAKGKPGRRRRLI